MIRYCLDTTAYSNFKRGHRPVIDLADSAHSIGISSAMLGEEFGNTRMIPKAARTR